MKNALKRIARTLRQLRGLLPSALPTGQAAFEAWVADIRSTYDMPTQDSDSVHYSFATMIMHSGPTESSKPKYYFVKAIRAAAAKQVAGQAFQDIKSRQQALAAERQRQSQAEATALSAVASGQTN